MTDFGFLADPPVVVGDLAAALGVPLDELFGDGRMASVGSVACGSFSASYHWDVHHEHPVASPQELAERRLLSYAGYFPSGRAECEAALLAYWGLTPGAQILGRRRYGPYFVNVADGDAFTLEWYETEPDWAKPPPDAAARHAQVQALARSLEAAGPGDHVEHRLEFAPPMPAEEFAAALGMTDPIAESVGVHMESWRLVKRIGSWRIDAWLGGWPSGEQVQPGPVARYRIGPGDGVRQVEVTPAGDSPC